MKRLKQRVEVKFECEARRITHSNNWECYLSEFDRWINVPGQYVKPIMAVETTDPGYYKITYANGNKIIAYRSTGYWYHIGEDRQYNWSELGNIIEIERLEL